MAVLKAARVLICAASLPALALTAMPAAAQTLLVPAQYYPGPARAPLLPPHEMDALVRSLGLTPVSAPRPHGPMFVAHAAGRDGTLVRVVVDRRSARIVQITRLGPSGPYVAPMRPGWGPPDYDDEADFYDDPPPPAGLRPPGPVGLPRTGPHVITRDSDVTGSVPRSAATDALRGVPPEFRRTPPRNVPVPSAGEKLPRIAPLPQPRPQDAPAVAERPAPAPAPAARPAPKQDFPPVQPLE